uniref:non-specific serine/threonine protein kinase n=1 Tax=Aegilops tauschii subsp. strangulata TaxID=200361 RepID=A0A453QZ41_AEGTS
PTTKVLVSTFLSFFLFLFHGASPAPVASVGAASEEGDSSALLAFKSAVSDDPKGVLAGWGASPDACNWTGVACDPVTRRVVQLVLREQKLSGELSSALGNLSHLRVLNLSGNLFAGSVPPELGSLSRLKQLSLADNQFQGSIPVELTRVLNLEYLNLGGNNLSGPIPAAIFCNLSALQYIDMSSNILDGEIPIRPDCLLPNLTFLVLWSNNLVGGIPPSLSNSTKLRWLLLESNFLGGELPSDGMFGGMRSLELLYLSFNYFRSPRNNTDLQPFFASLTNCTGLRELGVAGNDLPGTIPPVVGRLSPGLRQLHLEFNSIFGPIPANLSDLANLTTLNLSHNLLNGSIPPGLSRMQRLERLHLSNNLLSGDIPPSLGSFQRLGLLDLSQNQLAGAIPPSIVQCVNLLKLDLSHNMLRGVIPVGLSELSALFYLNLSSNLLSGAIPATIGEMDKLQVLNLSSNRLSGTIPPELGGCVTLEYLDLSANALVGGLPETLGSLQFLQVLDVSCNGLTGDLPRSMENMASLRLPNFSYNGFSGEVPSGGAFPGFPADAFLGDAGLCTRTASMASGLARCGGAKRRVLHNRRVVVPVAVTVASFTVAIIGLAACRAVARTASASVGRDGRRSTLLSYGGDEPIERGDHPRISHRELSEATGGFEQSSLIGAGRFGRVHEGTLRDGTRVAVKVLDPKTGGGEVSRSFKRECDVLRRTRHRNLVRVVTTCSQPDFHALVLPLMTNGSLESRIYPRDGRPGRGMDLARVRTRRPPVDGRRRVQLRGAAAGADHREAAD